jgi:response regulator NasT
MREILLVDDDRLNLSLLASGLRDAGYQVATAESGEDAVSICEQVHPDLAVLDIELPKMTGVELAKWLAEKVDIPFIFLTAHGDKALVDDALSLGAIGYLVKPIDVSQLIPAIEAAFNRLSELRQLKASEGHLRTALKQKRETSIAIGILMERHALSADEAFSTLRKMARSERRKVIEISANIIAASELLSSVVKYS